LKSLKESDGAVSGNNVEEIAEDVDVIGGDSGWDTDRIVDGSGPKADASTPNSDADDADISPLVEDVRHKGEGTCHAHRVHVELGW
jgi:hypothetical protein